MVQQSVEKVVMESLTEASADLLGPLLVAEISRALAGANLSGVAAAPGPSTPLRMKRGCILSKFKKSKGDKQ